MVNEKGAENSEKINLIASLLIDIKEALTEKMSVKDKVAYLVKKGVSKDDDIVAIIGITRSHASKEKAMLKKGGKENDGREEII
mgnify:CR=1 FL=1